VTETVFTARDVVKTFPGVTALENVDLTLLHGSIHALLGENGAGKSTLIKVMTGVYRPDSGSMTLAGNPFDPHNTRDAIAQGIGVVHQERNLIPRFSIAENIFLEGLSPTPCAASTIPRFTGMRSAGWTCWKSTPIRPPRWTG